MRPDFFPRLSACFSSPSFDAPRKSLHHQSAVSASQASVDRFRLSALLAARRTLRATAAAARRRVPARADEADWADAEIAHCAVAIGELQRAHANDASFGDAAIRRADDEAAAAEAEVEAAKAKAAAVGQESSSAVPVGSDASAAMSVSAFGMMMLMDSMPFQRSCICFCIRSFPLSHVRPSSVFFVNSPFFSA